MTQPNPKDVGIGHKKSRLTELPESLRLLRERCWLYAGSSFRGYGHVHYKGAHLGAHRVVYENFVGPIPTGLVVDHLCEERICINPEHLEPVTTTENFRRHQERFFGDVCINGHARATNLTWHYDRNLVRYKKVCKACDREYRQRTKEKKRLLNGQ